MTARNHHYLPQCYLKGFALNLEKPQLQVFDLEKGKAFKTSVRNIGSERDFNRAELPDKKPDELEGVLSKLEAEVEQAIASVVRAGNLQKAEDLGVILNLVALVLTRNPLMRDHFGDMMEKILRRTARAAVSSQEVWDGIGERLGRADEPEKIPYDEMKKFIQSDKYDVRVRREFHIAMELKLALDIVPLLVRRKWILLNATSGSGGFITSDHPASLSWTDAELAKGPYSPGLGLAKTMVLFPLTKEFCLMGIVEGADEREWERRDLGFLQVAAVNGEVIHQANRQVYAADDLFVFADGGTILPIAGHELLSRYRRPGHKKRARQSASKPKAA